MTRRHRNKAAKLVLTSVSGSKFSQLLEVVVAARFAEFFLLLQKTLQPGNEIFIIFGSFVKLFGKD